VFEVVVALIVGLFIGSYESRRGVVSAGGELRERAGGVKVLMVAWVSVFALGAIKKVVCVFLLALRGVVCVFVGESRGQVGSGVAVVPVFGTMAGVVRRVGGVFPSFEVLSPSVRGLIPVGLLGSFQQSPPLVVSAGRVWWFVLLWSEFLRPALASCVSVVVYHLVLGFFDGYFEELGLWYRACELYRESCDLVRVWLFGDRRDVDGDFVLCGTGCEGCAFRGWVCDALGVSVRRDREHELRAVFRRSGDELSRDLKHTWAIAGDVLIALWVVQRELSRSGGTVVPKPGVLTAMKQLLVCNSNMHATLARFSFYAELAQEYDSGVMSDKSAGTVFEAMVHLAFESCGSVAEREALAARVVLLLEGVGT